MCHKDAASKTLITNALLGTKVYRLGEVNGTSEYPAASQQHTRTILKSINNKNKIL